MAAVDKVNEFYTCIERFGFLASSYRPENLPEEVNKALDTLVDFAYNNKEIRIRIEEAKDWFREMDQRIQHHRRKELIDYMLREMSCDN